MNNNHKYAVIFTSVLKEMNVDSYAQMAMEMEELAKLQQGFLGFDSARSEIGISVSYWDSLDAIKSFKQHQEHLIAQQKGKESWYKNYKVTICKVEREYSFGEF